MRVGLDDLGLAAGAAQERGEPLRRACTSPACAGSALTLGMRSSSDELVEPGLSHGARVYVNAEPPVPAAPFSPSGV